MDWQIIVRRYYEDLCMFDLDVFASACNRAFLVSRDWFPTLGRLIEICEDLDKMKPVKASMQITEGERWADNDAAQKAREILQELNNSKGIADE